MPPLEDLTGKRFGNLVVVDRAENRGGRTHWNCVHDNGTKWVVGAIKLKGGNTTGKTSKQRRCDYDVGVGAKNAALSCYRHAAKRRGLEDQLTDDEIFELHSSVCVYCGSPPSNYKHKEYNGGYRYNGIDRVDNSIGYVKNNVVPCCKHCNIAKGTCSTREFLKRCIAISKRFRCGYEDVKFEAG